VNSQSIQSVTPLELLRAREDVWSDRLSPSLISLVAEDVKTTTENSEQALNCLAARWVKEGPESKVLYRFPAVHVLTTTRVATDHYAASFWPQLRKIAGIQMDQGRRNEWGVAYIKNLSRLGLPTFDDVEDAGSRFVGPILMHSGVPTYCLPDLLQLVGDRRRNSPGLTPDAFVAWARERVLQDRLHSVDKPVQRFLRYGGEFATDIIDRIFELLDVVGGGGTGDDVELPQRFIDSAVEVRRLDGPLSTDGELLAPSAEVRGAVLMLDPYGRGPFVRLPSIPDADEGQVVWVVGADAEEERVASTALLPGYREPTPQVDVPVNRPVRQITAHLAGSTTLDFTVPVIDSNQPVLIFDEEGLQLSLVSPIRRGVVWILHPHTHPMTRPAEDRVVNQAVLPPGWGGWTLFLINLQGLSSLDFDGCPTFPVQARATPRVLLGEPVTAMRTMSGQPVFNRLPKIEIPDGSDHRPTWSVSLLDHTGQVLVRQDVSTDQECETVWESAPTDISGEVNLRIRGPWGRSAGRRFTLVQGLELRADPLYRRMTAKGLVQSSVRLRTDPGTQCSTKQIELSHLQIRQVVSVMSDGERLPLVVEPAHMSVAHLTASKTGQPSVTALQLRTEDLLDDPGVLVVSTGAQAKPTAYVHSGTNLLQTIEAQSSPGGSPTFRFPLSQVTDTLRAEQQIRLSIDPEGELALAFVRPGSLFSELSILGAKLLLADAPDVEGLTAICYRALAPWLPPEVIPVVAGEADLNSSLLGAGPLIVHVRVEDPWLPEPVPAWPHLISWVDQPGFLQVGPEHEVNLSAFLAGQNDLDKYEGDLQAVWISFDRLWQLGLGDRSERIDKRLKSLLSGRADAATKALALTSIAPERLPHVLIRTGLLTQSMSDSEDPIPVRRSNILPLTFLGAWLADADVVDSMVGVCGEVARQVSAGLDPIAAVGGFDQTADVLARMTVPARVAIYRTAGIVPAGLLDKDSRVLASEAVMAERDSSRLSWLCSNASRLNNELRQTFRTLDVPFASHAMDAKRHPLRPDGWRAVPEWSIGMAIACRISAHRNLKLLNVEANLRSLSDLAKVSPGLVTIDLIVADLLVRHSSNQETLL